MTDSEWERLEPLVPPAKSGGRPPETNMRVAINANPFSSPHRTGYPRRCLPREEFPPRSTVYNIFRNFQKAGVWDAIWEQLHMDLREDMGREASASAATIDSQSLKSAEKRGSHDGLTGYGAGKKMKGRKIHALVDTQGLPLRIVVHSAGVQDRDGAALVVDKICNSFPWLELLWADSGYNAHQVDAAVAKVPSLRSEIVKRSDDMKGFALLSRRWVVERTFSWFGHNRRLAKHWENLAATLQAFVALASIQIAIRQLAR